MRNIVLVGFMGTGKTAVGKRLAKKLGMKYISTDEEIEAKEKRPINDIFAKDGENYFRKIEKETVKKISAMQDVVIAAGGGAVLDEENMKNFRKNSIIICLNATAEEILKRTESFAHRPLLNVPDPLAKIKSLLESRAPYYAKADYTVDTTGKNRDKVVDEIVEIVRRK